MSVSLRIDGDIAQRLADTFGWPSKAPVFKFSNEEDHLYGEYDSGLDYKKDGHTFEWEWEIVNPCKKK